MQIFRIPVQWQLYGEVEIKAYNIQEAIKIAKEDDSIPLPDGEYLEGSWQVEEDMN